MYDVLIVGARCAGSPLGMLLARKGRRVLIVDKSRFPSDTVSTHVIWHAGLARAKKWGLLDRIVALGAPPIRTVRLDVGPFEIAGNPPPLDGIDFAMAPRRTVLDQVLVDAAREAGAEIREEFYVSEVVVENGRVTGVRGRAAGGAETFERARLVVGADGTRSLVAQAVKAPKYHEVASTGGAYYTYWRGGPEVRAFETCVQPSMGGALLPTNDGLACLVVGWRDGVLPAGTKPEEGYREVMSRIRRFAEFLKQGEIVEPLNGRREFPGFFRQSWGEGWALAGDAGYHKHPLSAQGISDAFRDADWLAEAIEEGLSEARPMNECLADFQKRRDEAVLPMYQSTCERASFEPPPPPVQALFGALRHNQAEADRFFGTEAGTVPMTEFFAPENLQRITGAAAAGAAPA